MTSPLNRFFFLQQITYPICNCSVRFSWDSKHAGGLIVTSFPRPIRAITFLCFADLFFSKDISLVCLVVYLLHCLFIGCLKQRGFEEGIFPLIFIMLLDYYNGGGSAPGGLGLGWGVGWEGGTDQTGRSWKLLEAWHAHRVLAPFLFSP